MSNCFPKVEMRHIVFALLSFLVVSPTLGQQAAGIDSLKYSFDFSGKSVKEALQTLAIEARVGIGYASSLVAGKTTQCEIEEATVEAVLGYRCRDRPYLREDGGRHFSGRENTVIIQFGART